jgi:hypothetical protein
MEPKFSDTYLISIDHNRIFQSFPTATPLHLPRRDPPELRKLSDRRSLFCKLGPGTMCATPVRNKSVKVELEKKSK